MKLKKHIALILTLLILGCQANREDLKYEKNYLKGLALSGELHKPIFLHFTTYALGYDEFKYDLSTSKEILNKLKEEFVTIQLYVDDRKLIQPADTLNLYTLDFSEVGQKRIRKATKVGHINSVIQTEKYNQNSQPLYVILDEKGNELIKPFGYTGKNRKKFLAGLEKGLQEYKKQNRSD